MRGLNRAGNLRGVTGKSKDALKKAQESRRKGPGRGRNSDARARATLKPRPQPKPPVKVPAPVTQFQPLITGSKEKLHANIKKQVDLLQMEPGALTATLLGTLMANLDEANDTLPSLWKRLRTIVGGEDTDVKELTALLKELRAWTKVLTDGSIHIAEVQAKNMGPSAGPVDPLDQYRDDGEEEDEDEPVAVEIEDSPTEPQEPLTTDVKERNEDDGPTVKIG